MYRSDEYGGPGGCWCARGFGLRKQVVLSGPDRCGAHVNPEDPYDIAKFVIAILQDDELRRKLGKTHEKGF